MSTTPGPAALILAAGLSRRLGRPKQSIVLNGSTLLERSILTAQAAGLGPIIAVVNDPSWANRLGAQNVSILLNPNAAEGLSTSVRAGIQQLQQRNVSGAVLMTCDQPALSPGHLRALYSEPTRITGSRYAGRVGVPAYFPAATFPSLLELSGDAGARGVLQNAASITDETLALDIDTEEDLRRAQEQFASGRR